MGNGLVFEKNGIGLFIFTICSLLFLGRVNLTQAQEVTSEITPPPFGLKAIFKSPNLKKADQWSEIIENKAPLASEDLEKKRDSGYFVPIPLIAFDPDIGWGSGVRVYYYFNGKRDHPLFPYTPYFHRVFAQVFLTTKNAQFSLLDWDSPYLWGSLFRVRTRVIVARNPNSNYFQLGAQSLSRLRLPQALQKRGKPRSFSHFEDFDEALQTILPDGVTYPRYYKYIHNVTAWQLTLERNLKGVFRVLGGFRFEKSDIEDYTGREVETSKGKKGIMGTTLLRKDELAGKILGFRGGMDNVLKLGIAYDTRDYEPDPNRGIFADFTLEMSEPLLGSNFDYARALAAVRGYHRPFPQQADLVLAGRALYYAYNGKVPFFNMATIAETQGKFRGFGGRRTLRGFKQDRFVGKVGAMMNFEVRWNFLEIQLFEQSFAFLFTPFIDIGRIFDDTRNTTFHGWKQGQGSGVRIAWNQATLIAVEYAQSHEDSSAYLLFNHTF